MPDQLTFIHRFPGGVTCTATLPDIPPAIPPAQNQTPMVSVAFNHHWKPWPTPTQFRQFWPEYRQWTLELNDTLAKRWQISLMYIFQLSPSPADWECWHFDADSPPKRVPYPVQKKIAFV